jgi:hypothetical protein
MRVTLPVAVRADKASRTATGLVAPYGSIGYTNVGKLRFQKGSITWPDDLSRVKLMDYHQTPPVAVAYCSALTETDLGQIMTFQFGSTDLATQALQEALDRTRDGLSVELAEYVTAADGETVVSSTGTAVALVPVPAFADARVTSVAAAHHHQEGTTTMDENTQEPAVQAAATATVAVTGPIVEAPPADAPADAPAADAGLSPAVVAQAFQSFIRGDSGAAAVLAQAAGVGEPARIPDGLGGGAVPGRGHHFTRAEVTAALGRVIRGESRPQVEAALSDIVNTNVYEVVGQESYVGQLWSAKTYNRRFVPLLNNKPLTSWQVRGWKWGTRPGGAAYAGDKAAIPSNSPTVVPADTEASRWAGGHDLDIKFRHFGDTEFLDAYAAAMNDDYAVDSDAVALAAILASASTPTGWDSLGAGKNVIYGAMLAGDLMATALDQDVEPDYYLVSRVDRRALLDIVDDDKPAFMSMFGVDPEKFIASSSVATGFVYAGMKNALTWYELGGGSPLRVEALDLVKGGVDEAFFGYYATLLHDARGIVKVDLTA